jgi:methionyl-tRNA formyltransferase
VRAFTPNPGAWTTHKGSVIKIVEIGSGSIQEKLAPGFIHVIDKKIFVGTADEPVEIFKLVPAGKKEMLSADWLNGARIAPGEFFE